MASSRQSQPQKWDETAPTPFWPPLSRRAHLAEQMDCPGSDRRKLENTLILFGLINRSLARSRCVLKRCVLDTMRPGRPYHLLDLGAGSCETAVWLLKRSRALNLRLKVTACDHDERVVAFASERFGHTPGLEIIEADITALGARNDVDFVYANHLLHHLTDRKIKELIQYLAGFEKATVLFNDLNRSRSAYIAYYLAAPLFFSRSFARCDGLVSIRKGFHRSELLKLVKAADPQRMDLYRTEYLFPSRLLLTRTPLRPAAADPDCAR